MKTLETTKLLILKKEVTATKNRTTTDKFSPKQLPAQKILIESDYEIFKIGQRVFQIGDLNTNVNLLSNQ